VAGTESLVDYTCLRCGRREPEVELTRGHIIWLEAGGSDDMANTQPLCRACNGAKGARSVDYRPKAGGPTRERCARYWTGYNPLPLR